MSQPADRQIRWVNAETLVVSCLRVGSRSVHRMSAPKFTTDRSHYKSALESWFAQQHQEWADVEITDIDIPVATGFSNETVFCSVRRSIDGVLGEDRFVVRIEPTGGALFPVQTPDCAVSVDVQYRAMATVASHTAAPIPPLIGFEHDLDILGVPFFVMGHVDGRVPSDNPRYTTAGWVVDEASPEQRRLLVQRGLEAMAEVHRMNWQDLDLGWLDRSPDGHPTMSHQLELYRNATRQWLAGRAHPVLDAGLDWLVANDPLDDRIGMTWGDARLGNILWDGFEPIAVVDWEATSLCPLEADVGWWLMFDRMSFDDIGVERLAGYPTREEQIAHYETVSGREVRNPDYWEIFAIVRFCAIFVGLGDRLVAAGLIGEDKNPAVANMVTAALADRLGIDNPTPSVLG